MRNETIKKLCCPFDKAGLDLTTIIKDINENIEEGFLVCNECRRIYPIVRGIPVMSPDEYREFRLEQPVLERWRNYLNGRAVDNFRLVEPDSKNQTLGPA